MHDVVIGLRDPDRAAAIARKTGAGGGVTSGVAARDADVVILAVPWKAIDDVLVELALRAARDLERLIGVMTFVRLGRFKVLS